MYEEKLAEIQHLVSHTPILLFMKGSKEQPLCRFSLDVVRLLRRHQVDFETRDVLEDDILREAIKEFSDWPTLPQLYVNGEFIGGRDILMDLDESGELESVLKQ
ncbi:monothiol glutaredoxin, Grx4 family [Candidatus Gracilibacteria bacterium CG17_big_fil_post_rev_8_21_14_2_50_48_13]|nr:MAG: monothiol glutaredoxin, Grx4 family [Candidatus Gracilibacteria bacterium CG17_big_fil_post_rev_8_21_14_2_50_48_13]